MGPRKSSLSNRLCLKANDKFGILSFRLEHLLLLCDVSQVNFIYMAKYQISHTCFKGLYTPNLSLTCFSWSPFCLLPCSCSLGPTQCWVCYCESHQYGDSARSDDRLSTLLQPARGWEYMLSSSLDCMTGDSPQHNPHRGHITGPLVQLFHLQCMPLACS